MKINKLHSNSQFLIKTCLITVLCITSSSFLFAGNKARPEIKKEIIELQEILFNPGKSQLAILLSVNTKSDFRLDSVSLYIDNKKTKTYFYSERESRSLLNKAMQKLYIADISEGEHTLKAQFTAFDKNKKSYKISSSSKFTKKNSTKYVGLKISKSDKQDLPVLNIEIWE